MSPGGGIASGIGAEDERVLRDGLNVDPLPPEALARIRAAVEPVWRANVPRPPSRARRYVVAAGLLSGVLLVGVLVSRVGVSDGQGEIAAHLIRMGSPGVAEVRTLRSSMGLAEGAVMRSEHSYRSNGQSLLALEGGGELRVAAGTEFGILEKSVMRLDRGEFYVDIPPGAQTAAAFTLKTAAGEFHHVGTQFALAVSQGRTRLRVREGSVRWVVAERGAIAGAGTEVVFTNGTKSAERQISTSDENWDWIAATTPDFEIDNRPLGDFLAWIARQTGRKLIVADDQAKMKVASIVMHGSIRGLTPIQALSAVMSATELRYDLPDGQIRVSLAVKTTPSR
jgi:ferric-dicitrate binding protein FerR (iron transport regulator)